MRTSKGGQWTLLGCQKGRQTSSFLQGSTFQSWNRGNRGFWNQRVSLVRRQKEGLAAVAFGHQCPRLPHLPVSMGHLQLPPPPFLVNMLNQHVYAASIVPRATLLVEVFLSRPANNLCSLPVCMAQWAR